MHKQSLHQMCNPLHTYCHTSHYSVYLTHHAAQSLWNYAHVQEPTPKVSHRWMLKHPHLTMFGHKPDSFCPSSGTATSFDATKAAFVSLHTAIMHQHVGSHNSLLTDDTWVGQIYNLMCYYFLNYYDLTTSKPIYLWLTTIKLKLKGMLLHTFINVIIWNSRCAKKTPNE